jgi:hypothetical protein
MFARLLLAGILLACLAAPGSAQGINRRLQQQQQQPGMNAPIMDVQGTIEGVMRGGIVVAGNDNKMFRVAVPATAKIHVTGTATPDYLQTGMQVEFKGELDDQGALKESVDKLAIVGPDKQPGFFPPDSGGEHDLFGGEAAAGEKPAKHAKKPVVSKGPPAAGLYRIVGKLMVARGKTSLHVGRTTLPLELSDQATITFQSTDYSRAVKGDKISVKGLMMPSKAGPMVQATEVKIELSEPLVGLKKKGSAIKTEAKHPAKPPKKDADEGLPEPAAEK